MIPFSFLSPQTKAFTPASLPSVQAWIDFSNASSVTSSSSLISQANDLSGNSNNVTQGTGANQFTYSLAFQNGLNAALSNVNSLMTFANSQPGGAGISIACLVKTGATFAGATYYLMDSVGGNGGHFDHYFVDTNGAINWDFQDMTGEPFGHSSINLSTNTWYRMVLTCATGGVVKFYINNIDRTVVGEAGSGNFNTSIMHLGGPIGNSWLGYFGEAVLTNAVMSSTDRSNLDTYWTTKWAV